LRGEWLFCFGRDLRFFLECHGQIQIVEKHPAGAKQAAEKGLKTAQPEENHPSGPKGRAHFKKAYASPFDFAQGRLKN